MTGYLLTAPIVLGCLLFYGFPLLMVICYSMKSNPALTGVFVGWKNYRDILGNEMFRLAVRNTLFFFLTGLPLNMGISYGLALLLKKQAQKYELLKSVLLFPYVMPVVGTLVLVEQVLGTGGQLNHILGILGMSQSDWLGSSHAFTVVNLLYLWKNAGYGTVLLLAGLMTIPQEQYDVASLDGAGSLQRFLYITTPQMWNTVFFTLIFAVINGFKCFREIFLIGGKHPGRELYMMQHFINNSFENLNYGRLSVSSVLLFTVLCVVFGFLYMWVRKREI